MNNLLIVRKIGNIPLTYLKDLRPHHIHYEYVIIKCSFATSL